MKRQPLDWQSRQQDRLTTLLTAHPGLDAIQLKAKGYHPATHGRLIDAENGGWIQYRNGGWYLRSTSNPADRPDNAAAER